MNPSGDNASGYSLVELLVVLAVVAALAGTVAANWSAGAPARGLDAAHALMMQALVAARGRAAVDGRDVVLAVKIGPGDPEADLRELGLISPLSGQLMVRWPLPAGIIVVPPRALGLPGVFYAADWPSEAETTFMESPLSAPAVDWWPVARFTPEGRVSATGGRFVVAAARRHQSGWLLRNSELSRRLALSRYGVAMVNAPDATNP